MKMENKDFKIVSVLAITKLCDKQLIKRTTAGIFRNRKFDIDMNNYYNKHKEQLKNYD